MKTENFEINSIVEMKKAHPCGSKSWVILRTGAVFRIKCTGCERQVTMERNDFLCSVKKII